MPQDDDESPRPEAKPEQTASATELPDTLQFTYFKSNLFRVIHADGAIGGLVHRGSIFMNLFSERLPIPQQQAFQLKQDGRVGDEINEKRVEREGVIREVEVGVVLQLNTAKALRRWLDKYIKKADELAKSASATKSDEVPSTTSKERNATNLAN